MNTPEKIHPEKIAERGRRQECTAHRRDGGTWRCRIAKTALTAALLLLTAACGPGRTRNSAPEGRTEAPAACCDRPQATVCPSERYAVDSVVTLRGRVVLAHEVRSFTPEGDTTEYWIVDRSGALERAYDRVTGGQKSGKPALAGLRLRYKGPSDEGFAAEYAGVFEVVELLSVEPETAE